MYRSLLRGGLLTLLLTALMGLAQAAEYKVDSNHVDVSFKVRHGGLSWTRGAFEKVAGTVKFDPADPGATVIDITIQAESINTNNDGRDKHLRSADFLNVEKFPTLTFVSKQIKDFDGTSLKAVGDLTIAGVTREVVLEVFDITEPVTIEEFGGVTKRSASAKTKINRKDFNLTYGGMLGIGELAIGDEVFIEIDLELDRV